jgi:CHAT domain-containing protein
LSIQSLSAQRRNPVDFIRRSDEIGSSQGVQAAVQFLQGELQRAIQSGDERSEGWANAALAREAVRSRRFELAAPYVESARAIGVRIPDHLLEGVALGLSGFLERGRGNSSAAIEKYAAAFEEFGLTRDSPEAFVFIRQMTAAESRFAVKEYLFARAIDFAGKTGRVDFQREALTVWSHALARQGNYSAALEKLQQAAKMVSSANNPAAQAEILMGLARLYRLHGDERQALVYFERARELYKASNDALGESRALQALGQSYLKLGDRQKALESVERSTTLAEGAETRTRAAMQRLAGLGGTFLELGDTRRAIEILEGLLRGSGRNAPSIAYFFMNAAYFRAGRPVDALAAADRGLALEREGAELPGKISLLFARARTLVKLGRREEALRDAREGLRLIESMRANLIQADSLKSGYTSRYIDQVNFSIQLLWETGHREEAFEVAEQARARSLLDLLGTRTLGMSEGDSLTEELEFLDDFEMAPAEPILPSTVSAPPATLDHSVALAKRLNTHVLSYWMNADALFIWVVGADGVVAAVRQDTTQRSIEQLIAAAESRSAGIDTAWRELYRQLIAPVKSRLPRIGSRLTIIPHGDLFRLPFAALKDPQGRYLIEDYVIDYAPALATFDLAAERSGVNAGPLRYLLAADPLNPPRLANGNRLAPLAGSKTEVQKIAAQLPKGEVTLMTGAGLRLSSVLRSLEQHAVIHFATHAVVDAERPLESFLALSEGEKLTARDIYDASMNADLVMLSACRSASGPISTEGVLGLTRAFLYAGAASVIASIWDVPDEPSTILVDEFYREYRRSGEKDRALRAGQLRLLQELRAGRVRAATPAGLMALPEHPSLWAGFILIGRP